MQCAQATLRFVLCILMCFFCTGRAMRWQWNAFFGKLEPQQKGAAYP